MRVHHLEETKTYVATVTERMINSQLQTKEVKFEKRTLEKHKNILERDGKVMNLTSPEEIMRNENLRNGFYDYYLASRKIDVAPEEEAEGALKDLTKDIIFYSVGVKFGSINVKFKNQKTEASIETK